MADFFHGNHRDDDPVIRGIDPGVRDHTALAHGIIDFHRPRSAGYAVFRLSSSAALGLL